MLIRFPRIQYHQGIGSPNRSVSFLYSSMTRKEKFRRGKRGGISKQKRKNTSSHTEGNKTITIFNLSDHTLNAYETRLLEKGLSFCPKHRADNFQLFIDLHHLARNLTLKRLFSIQEQNKNNDNISKS